MSRTLNMNLLLLLPFNRDRQIGGDFRFPGSNGIINALDGGSAMVIWCRGSSLRLLLPVRPINSLPSVSWSRAAGLAAAINS